VDRVSKRGTQGVFKARTTLVCTIEKLAKEGLSRNIFYIWFRVGAPSCAACTVVESCRCLFSCLPGLTLRVGLRGRSLGSPGSRSEAKSLARSRTRCIESLFVRSKFRYQHHRMARLTISCDRTGNSSAERPESRAIIASFGRLCLMNALTVHVGTSRNSSGLPVLNSRGNNGTLLSGLSKGANQG